MLLILRLAPRFAMIYASCEPLRPRRYAARTIALRVAATLRHLPLALMIFYFAMPCRCYAAADAAAAAMFDCADAATILRLMLTLHAMLR